jgi:hypothetical protein
MSLKWLLDTTFHPTFWKKIIEWTPHVYFEKKILIIFWVFKEKH